MRNRDLHDALRDFALEVAAFLTDEVKAGAELEFDVIDSGHGSGPALYHYQPRTAAFLDARWEELRALPACRRAAEELGAGAAPWLRVNGMRGEQAEPALRAMIDRLYEDATSFGLPEERFERLYEEVESTLFRDAVRARLVAPLAGVQIESDEVDLGGGLSLGVGDCVDAPAEAVWPEGSGSDEPMVLCVIERDVQADDHIPAVEAEERFRGLVTALRLWAPGAIALCAPGWRRSGEGRWGAVAVGGARHHARRAVDARGRRGGRPARVPERARRHARRRARGLGARALRDGLRARARRRGAVRLPARPAGPARRHEPGGRGEPRAARGGALRRGGRAARGAAADRGRARPRAVPHGRPREPQRADRLRVPARAGAGDRGPPPRRCCATCSAATWSPT